MNGRALSAILMLLVLLAVGLVSTPALSGEHPWDSDDSNDGPILVEKGMAESSIADTLDVEVGNNNIDDNDPQDATASSADSSVDFATLVYSFFGVLSVGL